MVVRYGIDVVETLESSSGWDYDPPPGALDWDGIYRPVDHEEPSVGLTSVGTCLERRPRFSIPDAPDWLVPNPVRRSFTKDYKEYYGIAA